MKSGPRVAVLGAGIMGCCTALLLARRGCAVTLIDKAPAPMSGASRWNEGKIHLGFLYAADPSGRTAEKLLPGGLTFRQLIEEMIGESIEQAITPEPDIYLMHPDSVVDADGMAQYFSALDARLRGKRGYLAPLPRVTPLSKAELNQVSPAAKAGFRVPERSVNTLWVADRLLAAITAEPRVQLLTGTKVTGLRSTVGSWDGPWRLDCEPIAHDDFDIVINALWEGRPALDAQLGIRPEGEWSHRYRLALFVETAQPLDLPNAVLATGPFGDVKNYDGVHFYLSWYPAGLTASGNEVEPPVVQSFSDEAVISETVVGLSGFLPRVAEVMAAAKTIHVAGGWVFAIGAGALSDANASLHRRDRFGLLRRGSYYSVDTGKYSTAPWLAARIADEIIGT
jgi:glycine/D-amino acid oxidase-like deaminating enzyme